MIAVERRDGGPGRTRMRRIPDASKDVLTDFVLDHVQRGSEVNTDGWVGYNGVGEHRFSHVATNIAASGDPAHVAMPEVHRVASLLKRWLLGKIYAQLDDREYEKGVAVSDEQLAAVNLTRDAFHGEWNYSVKPSFTKS